MTGKTYQQLDARETEHFGLKYGNQEDITQKAEWMSNIVKELKGCEEDPKAEIHIDLFNTTLKTYQIGKHHAMIE